MNLLHLKYAVQVSTASSITKAAEQLYISQPNLSRAIKELEEGLGIRIFNRTPHGITVTPEGEEFLRYARSILSQVDAVEALYHREKTPTERFSISVPRASYIADAFTAFTKQLSDKPDITVFYKETNAMRAIRNILNENYALGIIRFQSVYAPYFSQLLARQELASETICDFRYVLLMSKHHPLATTKEILLSDLAPFLEIAHADPFVPSVPPETVQKDELSDGVRRRIFIFERGSQMELLSETPGAFMWVSPVPQKILDRYGLIQRACTDNGKDYRDLLVYKEHYRFTDLDQKFLSELRNAAKPLTSL